MAKKKEPGMENEAELKEGKLTETAEKKPRKPRARKAAEKEPVAEESEKPVEKKKEAPKAAEDRGLLLSIKEIKSALSSGNVIVGTNTVLRDLKTGTINTAFFASNCPDSLKNSLQHYARVSDLKIKEFEADSARLGEVCGKPFNILVVGIKRGK